MYSRKWMRAASFALLVASVGQTAVAAEVDEGNTVSLARPATFVIDNAGAVLGLSAETRIYAEAQPTIWLRRDIRNKKVEGAPVSLSDAQVFLKFRTPSFFSTPEDKLVPMSDFKNARYDANKALWTAETSSGSVSSQFLNVAACPAGASPTKTEDCLFSVATKYRVRGMEVGSGRSAERVMSMDDILRRGGVVNAAAENWQQQMVAAVDDRKRLEEARERQRAQYAAERAARAEQERTEAFARWDKMPPGSQLFCNSDDSLLAVGNGRGIDQVSYACNGQRDVGLRELLGRGWKVTNQTMTPVETYGGVGYTVHLVLTK